MFGKVASEALGLSDIGKVIEKKDFDKTEADDYVMHEDNEEIFFLIKSKRDEYCFTNKAIIHVDGTSATSKKRTLKRYSYARNSVSHVMLETAGTIDIDVEIKFALNDSMISIDIKKSFLEQIKDLYKTLIAIEEIGLENKRLRNHAQASVDTAANSLVRNAKFSSPDELKEANDSVRESTFNWLKETDDKYFKTDYSEVFEKYINN